MGCAPESTKYRVTLMRRRLIWGWLEAVRNMRAHRFVVLFVLGAFLAQGVVTTSHFHLGFAASSGLSADQSAFAPAQEPTNKTPLHDEANCPIWQAAGVCGSALPVQGTAVLPSQILLVRWSFDPRVVAVEYRAAFWQSRAPPLV